MKSIHVVLAGLALCLSTTLMQGQPPPPSPPGQCASDCSGFFMQGILNVEIYDGCFVRIVYQHRLCGGVYELNVLSASATGTCTGISGGDLVQRALMMIVHENRMAFPPFPMSTAGTLRWRISRPACWQKVSGDTNLVKCSAACCVNDLDVIKKDDCEDFQIAKETIQFPPRGCPLPIRNDETETWTISICTDACGKFFPSPGEQE